MGRRNPFNGATLANTLEHYHRIKSLYVKENEKEDYSPDMENMDKILAGKPIRRHIKNHKRRELVYSKLFELTPSEKALIRDLENAGLLPKKPKVSAHKVETKLVFKTEVHTTTKEVINPFTGKVMMFTEEEYRKYESIISK